MLWKKWLDELWEERSDEKMHRCGIKVYRIWRREREKKKFQDWKKNNNIGTKTKASAGEQRT